MGHVGCRREPGETVAAPSFSNTVLGYLARLFYMAAEVGEHLTHFLKPGVYYYYYKRLYDY